MAGKGHEAGACVHGAGMCVSGPGGTHVPDWRPKRPLRLGPCLCAPPASMVWHCEHLVLKILAPFALAMLDRELTVGCETVVNLLIGRSGRDIDDRGLP